MTTVLQRRSVPETIRALSDLPDYVDVFTLRTSSTGAWSPEQWARAGLDRAAGQAGQFVWRVILGLRLERSPDNVAGWKIADGGDAWLRLEAASWCLTAHIVVYVEADQVTIATFIGYDRPVARLVWPRLAVVHRRAMPGLMRRAARVLADAS